MKTKRKSQILFRTKLKWMFNETLLLYWKVWQNIWFIFGRQPSLQPPKYFKPVHEVQPQFSMHASVNLTNHNHDIKMTKVEEVWQTNRLAFQLFLQFVYLIVDSVCLTTHFLYCSSIAVRLPNMDHVVFLLTSDKSFLYTFLRIVQCSKSNFFGCQCRNLLIDLLVYIFFLLDSSCCFISSWRYSENAFLAAFLTSWSISTFSTPPWAWIWS